MKHTRTFLFLAAAALGHVGIAQSTTYDARIDNYVGLRAPCDGSVQPVLRIQNVGGETMTSCDIDILKNGVTENTFNWVLAIPAATGEFRQPALPPVSGLSEGDELTFRILTVNGNPDEGLTQNELVVPLTDDKADAGSYQVRVQVLTDGTPEETSWTIRTATGTVVAQSPVYGDAGTLYTTDLQLNADQCYGFEVADAGGDGLGETRAPAFVKLSSLGSDLLMASGDFGTSYRGVAQAGTADGCLPAQLTTTPEPAVSCGAVGLLLNGSSTIHATEVPGAGRYQFRFTNVPGQPAYARNIASPTRSLTLTRWSTLPLKRGRSYQVQVRASFDNGATWCAFGPSCTIAISNAAEAQPRMAIDAGFDLEAVLFPNPTPDGRLSVRLDGMDAEEELQVEVFNAMGGLEAAGRQQVAEGVQQLAVPVLAPGMHMVRLTLGGSVQITRVMVR